MLEIIIDDEIDPLPEINATLSGRLEEAVSLTLKMTAPDLQACPLCLRLADDAVVQQLNDEWRHKNAVTDVLSFPMQDGPDFLPELPLGDIILAWPFVTQEAARLGLPVVDHALHLVIHGVLHLLGYDHIEDADAAIMQQKEREILRALGLHDPYPA